jgi:predicted amidohydrolase
MRVIAVAQTVPVPGDIDANLAQHLSLVHAAAEHGPQVLVFPELSLTGYELGVADSVAFAPDDPRLTSLIDAAASYSMTLVVGAPVRIEQKLHIGAFIISPRRTVGIYTKHYLGAFLASASRDGRVPPAERTIFEPGSLNPLVHFGSSVGAVAVCADTGRPSHPQQAAARGAGTYFAGMFVIPSDYDAEAANLRASAIQHSMAVAFANFGGPTGGLASAGRSAIWSEAGALLVELESTGSGVAVATETRGGWHAASVMLREPGLFA